MIGFSIPSSDDRERIALWAQVITGIEADENGNARALSADEWQTRKDRLEKPAARRSWISPLRRSPSRGAAKVISQGR